MKSMARYCHQIMQYNATSFGKKIHSIDNEYIEEDKV